MKKVLIALTAFAATFVAVPDAAMAARADVAQAASNAESSHQASKQRRNWDRRGRHWNRGNRWGRRTVCRREWRRGRPVRICRTVRYRRW